MVFGHKKATRSEEWQTRARVELVSNFMGKYPLSLDNYLLDIMYYKCYNAYMDTEPHQTMRIWKKTHKLLRLIAAHTDESMVVVMHRLAEQEYQRVQKELGHESDTRLQDRAGLE